MGSKVLESYVCVSNSEIKAEKEQPNHEICFQNPSTFSFYLMDCHNSFYDACAFKITYSLRILISRRIKATIECAVDYC